MSKTLEKGNYKIQEICDKLLKETLDPAKESAEQIIHQATLKAEEIIAAAEKQKTKIMDGARAQIEKEKEVFQTSLNQSVRQTIETLRQQIVEHLFIPALAEKIDHISSEPDLIKNLITAIVEAIKLEGIDADLSVEISKKCKPSDVAHAIGKEMQERLRIKTIEVGDFQGGIRVRLLGKNYTIDMTEATLIDLFSGICRKEVREMLFDIKK